LKPQVNVLSQYISGGSF